MGSQLVQSQTELPQAAVCSFRVKIFEIKSLYCRAIFLNENPINVLGRIGSH
jgi:hypothetical protein